MGWFGTPGSSKQDIIDSIKGNLGESLKEHKVVREDGETVLWVVGAGNDEGKKYQYIACYLIQNANGCWGYKPLDETMGPCYYSVPKRWLDKYPCVTSNGRTGCSDIWRAKVKAA